MLQFILEFNVSYYWVYRTDAGVQQMFERIRAEHLRRPRVVRVGASWELADSLNFYRAMRSADWMRPVTRQGADCYFDYYLLVEKDRGLILRYDLIELYRDTISGASLVRPSEAALRRLGAVFPPPIHTAPPCRVDPQRLASFVKMSEPDAEEHLVEDVQMGQQGGDARWTYARPILLFRPGARFSMRIRLFQELFPPGSGPLEISVSVNARPLAKRSFSAPGDYDFEAPVPPQYTSGHPLAAVEILSSRHFTPPGDDAVLGFQLLEAGFSASQL